MSSNTEIILAIALSIVGNVINGFGYIVQKMAHSRMRQLPPERVRPFTKDSLWLTGFAIYAIGSGMHAAALAFGPQALLTPMESFTLVTNAILAPVFLGEKLQTKDMWATFIIIAGTTLAVIFGPHGTEKYDSEQLFNLYVEPPFLAFTGTILLFCIVDFILIKRKEYELQRNSVILSGDLNQPGAKFLALSYTTLAGCASCYTMILTKSTAETIETTATGNNQFNDWKTWINIAMFVVFNITLEYWKQRALKIFDALYVIPVFQVMLVILSIIGGAIYFQELTEMTLRDGLLFSLGAIVIVLGIWVLSTSEATELWNKFAEGTTEMLVAIASLGRRMSRSISRSVSKLGSRRLSGSSPASGRSSVSGSPALDGRNSGDSKLAPLVLAAMGAAASEQEKKEEQELADKEKEQQAPLGKKDEHDRKHSAVAAAVKAKAAAGPAPQFFKQRTPAISHHRYRGLLSSVVTLVMGRKKEQFLEGCRIDSAADSVACNSSSAAAVATSAAVGVDTGVTVEERKLDALIEGDEEIGANGGMGTAALEIDNGDDASSAAEATTPIYEEHEDVGMAAASQEEG